MAFFLKLLINKTNKAYNIYDAMNNYKLVGKINPREAYVLYGGDGDFVGINYLNSAGVFTGTTVDINRYPLPGGIPGEAYSATFCEEFPYGTANIKNPETGKDELYKVYKMRSKKEVITAKGHHWGYVAAGCLVATNSSTVGEDKPYCKAIDYVQSSAGNWVRVTGDGFKHGFVDTGIRSASGYSKIPFYGSW